MKQWVPAPDGWEAVEVWFEGHKRPWVKRSPILYLAFGDTVRYEDTEQPILKEVSAIVSASTLGLAYLDRRLVHGGRYSCEFAPVGALPDESIIGVLGFRCITADEVYRAHQYKGSRECLRCGEAK